MEFLPDLNDDKSMKINTSRDKEIGSKKLERVTNDIKAAKITTTTSRQWGGFKNPRIVRVSSAFGGKDRHSKVCTIRGLRDRRIRLSVPTAVQLYDLQHRLGLDQPSKVVDWLLEVTKHDIDKLPPLQMPAGGDFSQLIHLPRSTLDYPHHDLNTPQSSSLSPFFNTNLDFLKDSGSHHQILKGIGINDLNGDVHDHHRNMNAGKVKYSTVLEIDPQEKFKENERDDHQNINVQNQGGSSSNGGYIAQPQNIFPLGHQFPLIPSFLNNINLSSYNWDPSNLSLSQFGGQLGFSSQADSSSHSNVLNSVPSPSTSNLFCPPAATTTPPFFPPYMEFSSLQSDPRQQHSHFQLMSSSSQHSTLFFGPFKANSQENNNSQSNKQT